MTTMTTTTMSLIEFLNITADKRLSDISKTDEEEYWKITHRCTESRSALDIYLFYSLITTKGNIWEILYTMHDCVKMYAIPLNMASISDYKANPDRLMKLIYSISGRQINILYDYIIDLLKLEVDEDYFSVYINEFGHNKSKEAFLKDFLQKEDITFLIRFLIQYIKLFYHGIYVRVSDKYIK